MRYMAATARYTANCMQHSRNTTRNTTEQDRKIDLYVYFIAYKASKLQNAAPASI